MTNAAFETKLAEASAKLKGVPHVIIAFPDGIDGTPRVLPHDLDNETLPRAFTAAANEAFKKVAVIAPRNRRSDDKKE